VLVWVVAPVVPEAPAPPAPLPPVEGPVPPPVPLLVPVPLPLPPVAFPLPVPLSEPVPLPELPLPPVPEPLVPLEVPPPPEPLLLLPPFPLPPEPPDAAPEDVLPELPPSPELVEHGSPAFEQVELFPPSPAMLFAEPLSEEPPDDAPPLPPVDEPSEEDEVSPDVPPPEPSATFVFFALVSLPPVLALESPDPLSPVWAVPLVLPPLWTSPPMAGPDAATETAVPPALTLPGALSLELTVLPEVEGLLVPPLESVEQPACWHAPVLLSALDELSMLEFDVPPAPPAPPVAVPPTDAASPLVAVPLCEVSEDWLACCCWMFATAPSLITLTSGLVYPNAAGATIRKASAVTSPPSHLYL
jgi:hypothetical protein